MKESYILSNYDKLSPKEIFYKTCEKIYLEFADSNVQFFKSTNTIKFQNEKYKLSIFFSSVKFNDKKFVGMTIGFNLSLLNNDKLIGDTAVFYKKNNNPKFSNKTVIKQIFEKEIIRDNYEKESLIIYSTNFNAYNLTTNDFNKVIMFIKSNILNWLDDINSEDKITTLLLNSSNLAVWSIKQNENFYNFINANFSKKTIDIYNNFC